MSVLQDLAIKLVSLFPIPYQHEKEKLEQKQKKEELKKLTTIEDVVDYINGCTGKPGIDISEAKREVVISYINNLNLADKKAAKLNQKVNDLVLERAAELVGAYNTGSMDSELEKKINTLQMFSDQYRYRVAAIKAQQLINYAIWVSTDNKAIGLTNLDKSSKEFVNAICKLIYAEPQYKDVSYCDLELFDPWIAGWNNQRFLINLAQVQTLNSISMQDRINRKNQSTVSATSSEVRNNGMRVPLHFAMPNENNTLTNPEAETVDAYTADILERALFPYINGREHWYEKDTEYNFYKVYIRNPMNGIPEEHKLCVGRFGQDSVALVVIDPLGMLLYINTIFGELCSKIFDNCFYQVTMDDVNEAALYRSEFFWMYDMFDLSIIPEYDIQVQRLDLKLNNILGQLQQKGIDLSRNRYRFDYYRSIDDFCAISDANVQGAYQQFTTDGSILMVQNNEAVYRLNNVIEKVNC